MAIKQVPMNVVLMHINAATPTAAHAANTVRLIRKHWSKEAALLGVDKRRIHHFKEVLP